MIEYQAGIRVSLDVVENLSKHYQKQRFDLLNVDKPTDEAREEARKLYQRIQGLALALIALNTKLHVRKED